MTIAALEQVVRAEAARSELGTPASTELLASLDAVTSSRRQRSPLPRTRSRALRRHPRREGAALIANAGALGVRSTVRTTLLVVGLAVVVGLSLALLFSWPRHGAAAR